MIEFRHGGGHPVRTEPVPALLRYGDDGAIEIDNSAAEWALCSGAYDFATHDVGAEVKV